MTVLWREGLTFGEDTISKAFLLQCVLERWLCL